MVFSDFVESVIETPICCELKLYLDKLHEVYTKDPEKFMSFLEPGRGSAKADFLMLLPFFLKMYEEGEKSNGSKED